MGAGRLAWAHAVGTLPGGGERRGTGACDPASSVSRIAGLDACSAGQAKRRGLPRPAGPADPEAAAAAEARDAGGAFGGSESEEDLTVGDTTHPDLRWVGANTGPSSSRAPLGLPHTPAPSPRSDSDVEAAVEGYVRALERLERGEGPTPREMGARDAGAPRLAPPEPYAHVESESDSSEDDDRNTVGNVPLEWYRHEDHLGYDREGRAIGKVRAWARWGAGAAWALATRRRCVAEGPPSARRHRRTPRAPRAPAVGTHWMSSSNARRAASLGGRCMIRTTGRRSR